MKACIFDLDGTLTNTLDSLAYSVRLTMEEMGLTPITADECRRFVGDGARKLMERALKTAGDAQAKRLDEGMEIYGRIFDANCTYHVTPYEGVLETIKNLKERGIRIGVLSNKPHLQTVKVVREIFGDGVFDWVQGQMEGVARKPDPAGIYCMLEKMNVDAGECLYVGDSEVDIQTGAAASLAVISVSWGFRDRQTLKKAGAKKIIDRPEELLQFV